MVKPWEQTDRTVTGGQEGSFANDGNSIVGEGALIAAEDDLEEDLGADDDLSESLYDAPDNEGLFDGDRGDLPAEARYALTRLVRDRYVSDEVGGKYRVSTYALIMRHRDDIQRNLNNLCMTLNVNEKYRVAWASTAPFDGSMPGVVIKRSPVQKRDVTLLLITLRIAAQNAELDGRERWYIDRQDIDDTFVTYAPYANEGDAQLVRGRIDAAVSEACTCGYLEAVDNVPGRYRILPIVAAMLTLERAQELVTQLNTLLDTEEDA